MLALVNTSQLKMKKSLIIYSVGFLCAINCFAQQDPKASKILDDMGKKYQTVKSFKAEFTYTLESPAKNGVKENFKGGITVKGNKFYLDLGSQEVINNGTHQWTIMKDGKNIEVTKSDYTPDEDDITPTKIYTVYKKGFKYTVNTEANDNKVANDVIDLIPEDKSKPVFKIRIVIAKKDNSIKSWKIFEKNGNRYTYVVSKFTPNVPVEDKLFVYDPKKFKDAEFVDLTE